MFYTDSSKVMVATLRNLKVFSLISVRGKLSRELIENVSRLSLHARYYNYSGEKKEHVVDALKVIMTILLNTNCE